MKLAQTAPAPLRWLAVVAWSLLGCREKADTTGAAKPNAVALSQSGATALPSVAPSAPAKPPARLSAPPAHRAAGSSPFIIDEPVEVGPAGPAAADARGVVMVDRKDDVLLATLGPVPSGAQPVKTAITPLARDAADFAPYGRAPAIVHGQAHWVSEGRLVRRKLEGGALQILAEDARKRTRAVGAPLPNGKALIAYITAPDSNGAPHGKLWLDGSPSLELTPEGAGTSSIALAALGSDFLIAALDGRSGMTPLHARRLTFDGSKPRLGPDVVSWVGASAQATTEVFATELSGKAWAFVPIEADVTHFGLMQIELGSDARLDAPTRFLSYPNGSNSTPVAAAKLCGKPVVVHAQPESSAAEASHELVLSVLEEGGLGAGEVIVKRRSFAEVTLAALPGGGLLVYTASRRTWAATLRCR